MRDLSRVLTALSNLSSCEEKSDYLSEFVSSHCLQMTQNVKAEQAYFIKALSLIGEHYLASSVTSNEKLVDRLRIIDQFYENFGGILGYQHQVLKLLEGHLEEGHVEYLPPSPVDMQQESDVVREYILEGLKHLEEYAELYAIGGAADRLNLVDAKTKEDLPAAKLVLVKWTLLEILIRDLFAKEFLYFQLFDKQLKTPIAMMTSEEKNNDAHVYKICKEAKFFGRDPAQMIFFRQPLVPTFKRTGEWVMQESELLLKPGGHGMIWKLALQEKVVERLLSLGRKKALVRQINNPIAGTDYGLLAFLGLGFSQDYAFGFASCPRRESAKEGVNVLKKIHKGGRATFALSNIEYCDTRKDLIEAHNCPANTNILLIDLKEMEGAVHKQPYPGVLLNFKQKGQIDEMARLELTMQNIADCFEDEEEHHKKTFIALGRREKTIAATKRAYKEGSSFLETPEGAIIAMLKNAHELLTLCGMQMPILELIESQYFKALPFFVAYHPALGPLYSIICQKIHGGSLSYGSELFLEIADLYMKDVTIDGSLKIETKAVMGHEENDRAIFSSRRGRCILERVEIINKGIDFSRAPNFVTGYIPRLQKCSVLLSENSEFIARDVTLRGDFTIHVPKNTRCIARKEGRRVEFIYEEIKDAYSLYSYTISDKKEIKLNRKMA